MIHDVTTIDDIELPHWIQQLGLKHPFRDKFNETHFLADIDIFLSDLKKRKVSGEALCAIEAAAKAYSKWVKLTPSGKREERGERISRATGECQFLSTRGLVSV